MDSTLDSAIAYVDLAAEAVVESDYKQAVIELTAAMNALIDAWKGENPGVHEVDPSEYDWEEME